LQFKRGFKAECERISHELRGELGLDSTSRLDPHALARHLAIPVLSVGALKGSCEEAVRRLVLDDPDSFSAVTVFCGTRRLILFNPGHAASRNANSVMHELAHVVLEHEPGSVRERGGGRRWRPLDEAEADWLAGAMLVPRDGALAMMERLGDQIRSARHFGVSRDLMRWRVNETGVAIQLRRRRAAA
jgi:hypothetical protein